MCERVFETVLDSLVDEFHSAWVQKLKVDY